LPHAMRSSASSLRESAIRSPVSANVTTTFPSAAIASVQRPGSSCGITPGGQESSSSRSVPVPDSGVGVGATVGSACGA